MFKRKVSKTYYMAGAAFTVGMMSTSQAMAGGGGANTTGFNAISTTVQEGVSQVPALITAIAYLVGTLLAALGAMKIKDHVENPTQTPLKDGAIRLLIGGFLFALPTLIGAMQETANTNGAGFQEKAAQLKAVNFTTQ